MLYCLPFTKQIQNFSMLGFEWKDSADDSKRVGGAQLWFDGTAARNTHSDKRITSEFVCEIVAMIDTVSCDSIWLIVNDMVT